MSGVPASETSAIDSPRLSRAISAGVLTPLVVLVQARRARRDGVVLKEPRRPAGILRRDQGDFAQNAEGPQRDIFEVADGSGDHIEDAGHARGADSTRMYSAEPLPHFVDEYLACLHEAHPTNATFDGVHLHDDLLEDLSRPAIDTQVRELGGFARRLAAIDPARLTDIERLERPALDASIRARLFELEEVRTWERNPQHYADLLATSLAGQALFDYAPLAERARRVLSKLRPGAAADAGGARQHQGSARASSSRSASRACAARCGSSTRICRAPSATSTTCTCSAISPTPRPRPSTAIGAYVDYLENDLAPRARGSFRLGRDALRAEAARSTKGITLDADRLLAIAMRELHATQEEFRACGLAPQRQRSDRRLGTRQGRPSGRRPARPHRAGSSSRSSTTSSSARTSSRSRHRRDVQVAPTPRFYRWTFASMWTPGPFEARPLRAFYYITDVDPSWPAERKDEHLRDFNYGALWAISIHEVFPGHFLHYQHLRQVDLDAAQVDPLLVDRDGRRLGALLRTDDGRGGLPQAGSARSGSASSPKR